jgi:phage terminase large subunit
LRSELAARTSDTRAQSILAALGTPSPRQVAFLEHMREGVRFPFYGGARGGGKSWAMRAAMLELLLAHPGASGLILRRTYEELETNYIFPLLLKLPKGSYNYNAAKHRLTLYNGSTLSLGFCRHDTDVMRYQGNEYDYIAIDELTQWQEFWLQCIRSSLRTTKPGVKTQMLLSGNPGGLGHMWVKRLWIDRQFTEREVPEHYVFVPAKVYDNPTLMENDPEYVANLESISDENLRRAWLDGDWDIFAGQFFHELRRDVHGFKIEDLPAGWTFRCLDYGERAPSAVYWVRVDAEGDLWFFRELYGSGYKYSELAEKIKEMTEENIRYTVASPDIFATSKGTGVVGSEEMAKHKVPIIAADNNRIEGWRHMREWLGNPANIEQQPARLHVCIDTCREWWRTVPAQIYDEHKVEDMDPDGEDHAAEATRYGVQSRPMPRKQQIEKLPYDSAAAILARRGRTVHW